MVCQRSTESIEMFGVLRVSVRWKMRMEIDDQVSDREWDPFVATHPAGHVLQTSGWAAHKSEFGWQVERVVVRNRGAWPAMGSGRDGTPSSQGGRWL
jgi:hypothetical protein